MKILSITLAGVCALVIFTLTMGQHRSVEDTAESPSPCTGKLTPELVPDPTNSSRYYFCWGKHHFPLSCEANASWQPEKKTCVQKRSPDDICPCENRLSGICWHPTNCAQYFNCSASSSPLYVINKYLDECRYPNLFSMATRQCEHFTQVDCAYRVEAKNPCDYQRNHYCRIHCPPCSSRYPDCTRLPDGANIWRGMRGSAYFCICKNERMIYYRDCSRGRLFHPNPTQMRRCRSLLRK